MLNSIIVNWMFYFYKESVYYDIRGLQFEPLNVKVSNHHGIVIDFSNQAKLPGHCTKILPPARIYEYDEFKECTVLLPVTNEDVKKRLLNPRQPLQGFIITYANTDFRIYFKCSPRNAKSQFQTKKKSLIVWSRSACGKTFAVGDFIQKQKYVVSALLLVFGVVLLFFGGSSWRSVVPLIGFFIGAFGIFFGSQILVYFPFTLVNAIIITACSIAVGVIFAYLAVIFVQLLHFVCGFAAGFIASQCMLYNINATMDRVIVILVGVACGVWIGLMCAHTAGISIILATAAFGSYLTIESLGFLGGWSPDYFKLLPVLKEMSVASWAYYGTLVGMFLLALLGFYVQKSRIKSI